MEETSAASCVSFSLFNYYLCYRESQKLHRRRICKVGDCNFYLSPYYQGMSADATMRNSMSKKLEKMFFYEINVTVIQLLSLVLQFNPSFIPSQLLWPSVRLPREDFGDCAGLIYTKLVFRCSRHPHFPTQN